MKKRFSVSFSALALALLLCLIIPVFSVSAVASEERAYEWILSEDGTQIIRSDGRIYNYFSDNYNFYLEPDFEYAFVNDVSLGDIYSYAPDGEIIWVENEYAIYLYTTSAGLTMLYGFMDGKYDSYRINVGDTYKSAVIDNSVIESMNALGVSVVADVADVDVTTLAGYTYHSIVARDQKQIFSETVGLVFEIDGGYYYVNFSMLNNSNFDAYGNFSFRSGAVPLIRLSGIEEATLAGAIENAKMISTSTDREIDRASAENAFWVMFVIVGFVAPIPVFIMGFYLANSAKRGQPRYWYSLSILAAVWFVLSIVLMLLMM